MAFFGALAARLYHLQVERSADFALLAEDNRANQRLLVPPRGRIIDRLGRPLARNVPTYRMLVIREQAGDLRPLLARLASWSPWRPIGSMPCSRKAGPAAPSCRCWCARI